MGKYKKIIFTVVAIVAMYLIATRTKEKEYSDNLRFNESTFFYDGGLLIANFGSSELNPLNQEGKGYIVHWKDEKSTILIPCDSNLNAPKGMLVHQDLLYICDVNRIVIYNLKRLKEAPTQISFPEADTYLNDIAINQDDIYVTVTNTGNIYKFSIDNLSPQLWVNIPGANGITINDNTIYVASYPPSGTVSDENVIYKITQTNAEPKVEKLTSRPGLWDGIAVSKDGKTLYASNWSPAGFVQVDLSTGEMTDLKVKSSLTGPADFTLVGNLLCIPDLVESKLIIKELK